MCKLNNNDCKLLWFIILVLLFDHLTSESESLEFACKPPRHSTYPFCNTSLTISVRAQSLISLLTLSEKLQRLTTNSSSIPRLGIPPYQWRNHALHGVAATTVASATSFPQVILTAASFNRTLWYLIGSAIGVEGRALYNAGLAGLTFWSPNVNVFRDPRWGRGQETPGEDPMVSSAYASEFVRGLQGGPHHHGLFVSACCKHFTAYDLDKWANFTKYNFNALVTQQDLEDTYLPPFRSCIQQGGASCLMCSFNQVNGVPACANEDLLGLARTKWGFQGYITSDCDAVATVYEYHKYAKSAEDAVADVLRAGVDINCGTYMLRHTQTAIKQGKVKEEELDRALFNLFSVQLRLGMFDGDPRKGQFGKLGPWNVCSTEHRTLALEAARQGIVLLKNENKILPLDRDFITSLAVIGPMATETKLGGDYSGCSSRSIYEELQEFTKGFLSISYASGCHDIACQSVEGFNEAIETAKEADYVIIVAGIDTTQEGEDLDRDSLVLPGEQMALISAIADASKRPVILVLTGGGPLDVLSADRNPLISSILWVGYPGEAGAKALAEIIFGLVNPAGRLPMTWYPESFTNVPMSDMNMRADPSRGYPGRTYRFYTGTRIYGFGHGLSYSAFSYKFLSSSPTKISLHKSLKAERLEGVDEVLVDDMQDCSKLRFGMQVSVMNLGDLDGRHVVMLFSRWPKVLQGSPTTQLVGFSSVHTVSYESIETSILVDPCQHLSLAHESGKRILPLGSYTFSVRDTHHTLSLQIY
ncbi:probable beta-D-xylosidase 6 isoform X2 [Arachis hypogaea]|uniref:probable beta-D-xylosidase 6 isoform X2 n=1 Tax=Arachis hypogaea TaxID=3818 RepID=UPI000DED040F|nr:probable beta-D-xylosidase 6 isoform X2 [Arachis hypogaea]